jgi:hypothetical protein
MASPPPTSKSAQPAARDRYGTYIDQWINHHPGCLHVFWSDYSNAQLVERHYPEASSFFFDLPTLIQQVDTIRLLYLHRFGGLYVDLDFECRANIFDAVDGLGTQAINFVVESPYLIREVTQNSLMYSRRRGQELWASAVRNVQSIRQFIAEQQEGEYAVFHNFWLKRLFIYQFTLSTTGPNLVDKSILKNILAQNVVIQSEQRGAETGQEQQVALLPYSMFAQNRPDALCSHHEHGSWTSNFIFLVHELIILVSVCCVVLLVGVGLIFFWLGQRHARSSRSDMPQPAPVGGKDN